MRLRTTREQEVPGANAQGQSSLTLRTTTMSFHVDPSTTFVDETLVPDVQAPIFSTHVDFADDGAERAIHIDLAVFNASAKVRCMLAPT